MDSLSFCQFKRKQPNCLCRQFGRDASGWFRKYGRGSGQFAQAAFFEDSAADQSGAGGPVAVVGGRLSGQARLQNLYQPGSFQALVLAGISQYVGMAQHQRRFLGICVGMQMLLTDSEEAPGVAGLNLIPGTVRKFEAVPERKVPQMGWNALQSVGDSALLRGLPAPAHAYFVHSYYVPASVAVDHGALTDYGVPFWAAFSVGNLHATQFHPEKSGAVGLAILERFRRNVLEN